MGSSLGQQYFNPVTHCAKYGLQSDIKSEKFDHITEAMKDLHWMKARTHQTPSYVIDLLDLNLARRNLRLGTQGKLPIQWCNPSQVCNSSIRYIGSRLWNELP